MTRLPFVTISMEKDSMEELIPFHQAVEKPYDSATAPQLSTDRKPMGFMCSYTPEELIHAAGFHPMRLFSSKSEINLADNHLQAYCCSLVRGVLEDRLAGRLDFLGGMVFPHTCDSILRLSDIWRLNADSGFFQDVVMPAKVNTPSARVYMKDVLENFRKKLGKASGRTVTDDNILQSIAVYNRIRKSLARIYELKSQAPAIIKDKDLFTIVKAAMVMDRKTLALKLDQLVAAMESASPRKSTAKRILLSGSVCDMPDLYTLIHKAGGTLVGDDLCSGQRWFEGLIPEDLPPMEGLIDRYANRLVCPAKHSSPTARGEALVSLARQRKADGVVFALLKFCDPHAFDYPYIKDFLDKAGIKSLLIELDDQEQGGAGQLATRMETFVHMI